MKDFKKCPVPWIIIGILTTGLFFSSLSNMNKKEEISELKSEIVNLEGSLDEQSAFYLTQCEYAAQSYDPYEDEIKEKAVILMDIMINKMKAE